MRVSTGIKNLDSLIEGGFVERSFNLIYGGGGTGKTLFTINYLLRGAESGEKVLYVTLEETWEDIVRKLPMGIKDRLEKVSKKFHYLDFGSLRPVLGKDVLKSEVLSESIVSSIKVNDVSLVGLDGIAPLSMYYQDERTVRSAIFDISQNLKSYGVTTVFTSEEVNGRSRYGAEEFVADSVIRLNFDGKKRRLQILKTRGSGFVGGRHGFEIMDDGIEVYPRVLPYDGRRGKSEIDTLGIQKLDNMIGEVYRGDITLITGPPGSGIYLFGISFIKSVCASQSKGAFISLKPGEKDINVFMKANTNGCRVVELDAEDMDIYKLMWKIKRISEGARRVVVHGLNVIARDEEYPEFIHSLSNFLRSHGISTMFTYTSPNIMATDKLGDDYIVNAANNIVKLLFTEINGELKKILAIIKTHSPTHETGLIEYRLGKKGIVIVGKVEEMEGIMSGTPTKQMEIKKRVERFFK